MGDGGDSGRTTAPKRKRPGSVVDQLRRAIRDSGLTHYRIGKGAGVKPEIVARFVRGERDVRAETFAKIAAALGLELRPRGE
jgi:plasmid maintenance system antidote protein VapI